MKKTSNGIYYLTEEEGRILFEQSISSTVGTHSGYFPPGSVPQAILDAEAAADKEFEGND